MEKNSEIDRITKRPIQYWFEDGIGELITGGLFVLIGIYFVLQEIITSPALKGVLSILSVFIIGGGVLLGRRLINKLKEQLVYPRTGYVTYPRRPSKGKLAVTLSMTIAVAIMVIMLGRSNSTFDWITFVIGAICGALMFFQAVQTSLFRLYLEATLAILMGAVVAVLGTGGMLNSGLYFLIYGLILIFAGGCALRNYFKKAPVTEEVELEK
jgi:hypothetical protein